MLWLAVYLPGLALEAFERGSLARERPPGATSGKQADAGETPALAICDATHVLAANLAARARGVLPGISRASAMALASDLVLRSPDPRLEQETLAALASWALQFTPAVSLQQELPAGTRAGRSSSPGTAVAGLLLEVEPSLRLFGGRRALIERVRNGVAELGFSAQTAYAPTPRGAWLLARHGAGGGCDEPAQLRALLASLPVGLLESARAHRAALEDIGGRTVGALLALPRAGIARRFGKELLLELDRALGALPEPRDWFTLPATFRARLELLAAVDNAALLLFAANRLLLQMSGWLAARQSAVREFELRCEHDDHPDTVILVRLAEPSRDPQRLGVLLREHLAPTRLAAPAHALQMSSGEVFDMPAANRDLFPGAGSVAEDLARLVERLQARLGSERVRHLRVADEHRPERAYWSEVIADIGAIAARTNTNRMVSSAARPAATTTDDRGGNIPDQPRPLWLLPEPIALGERGQRPFHGSALALLAGPERIEAGWWDQRGIQRDYFIAEDSDHRLLWIFRERLPDPAGRQGWFLHGLFGATPGRAGSDTQRERAQRLCLACSRALWQGTQRTASGCAFSRAGGMSTPHCTQMP